MSNQTSAYVPPVHPVSVKGVVIDTRGRVLLLKNEREEWELPGGRLEIAEMPDACVVREIEEESGWKVQAGPILDVWMYTPIPGRHVLIVTYGCTPPEHDIAPVISHEHKQIGLFTRDEVSDLVMPQGYKDSIEAWFTRQVG